MADIIKNGKDWNDNYDEYNKLRMALYVLPEHEYKTIIPFFYETVERCWDMLNIHERKVAEECEFLIWKFSKNEKLHKDELVIARKSILEYLIESDRDIRVATSLYIIHNVCRLLELSIFELGKNGDASKEFRKLCLDILETLDKLSIFQITRINNVISYDKIERYMG